ncbi:MAG: hypothetical protein NT088_05915 [Candidatus Omnitrophica bacterium]|nr:hypothetical protein [Candidatus Omnitrophota bacterium]
MINADKVEYLSDSKDVSAEGNVVINYKGSRLTCSKIIVNTLTKDGEAQGKVRLEDAQGVIEGEKLSYNFQTKSGFIDQAQFRMAPYFGRARHIEKVNDAQIAAFRGYFSTCSLDRPHFRITARKLEMFPKSKIESSDDILFLGSVPVICLPHFSRSLTDEQTHFQATPGKRKDWGPYILSNYRFNLTPELNSRVYLDYRNKLGFAEGFGFNQNSPDFGRGDFKFYYTKEKPDNLSGTIPNQFERYMARFRYQWNIDKQTNIMSEYYKITDQRRKKYDPTASFLKDYFYREFEKDSEPLSYIQIHHNFAYSSLDLLFQDRTNHWFSQINKLPELKYSMPSLQIGETPLYFENSSSLANFNQSVPSSNTDLTVARFDTLNKVSIPLRVLFVQLTPFAQSEQTAYDKGANGKALPVRTIFSYGADASTKFYRIFDIKTNLFKLDIDKLRHIITPTIGYTYSHTPTIPASNLKQIDSVDALTSSNSATLGLSNKLQTKRNGISVDVVDFLITSAYNFKPNIVSGNKMGGSLQDVVFNLKLIPYSWMRIEGDATYKHSGISTDADYDNFNHFAKANYNIDFDIGRDKTFGVGQRYERMGGNELTWNFTWRLNPKWKVGYYQKYNLRDYWSTTDSQSVSTGSLEQQFTLSRDMHCWEMDFTVDNKKNGNSGIYFVFRIKAFPENEFGFDQVYRRPKSGTQQ